MVPLQQGTRNDVMDGLVWQCPQCKTTKIIRQVSKSRLSLQKWLLLIYFLVKEYPVKDAASDVKVDKNTTVDVYRWLREVCSTKPLANCYGRP